MGAVSTRGATAALAILDELDEQLARIWADPTLSGEERNRLTRAARARAQVELGALVGSDDVNQAFLARLLAQGLDLTAPPPRVLRRPWWKFWA
jgi:sugar/nucleoside kinase (ribokinase family)